MIEKNAETDADIIEILTGNFIAGAEPNRDAAAKVEEYLIVQDRTKLPTSMFDVQSRYQGIPYGWREIDIAAVVALLINQQKVTIKYGGATIQPNDPKLPDMLPGNGKFERTGIGSDRDAREATNTAFNFLKANGNRISGSISTTTRDYIINYQDLQGIGMTGKLALPSLIALCSIALGKPVLSSTAILGEISISGTIIKVDELANALQVCLDSGAKRVLLPMTAAAELGTVPADLIGCFNLIFYSSAEDAVFKALGVE